MASQLVTKSKSTKSAVWAFFGFEGDEEGKPKQEDIAICRICERKVSAKGGNTSNLLSHLKNHHPLKYNEVKKAGQSSNTSSEGSTITTRSTKKSSSDQSSLSTLMAPKYDRKSKKWQQLTDKVTHFIAKDMMPIYTVEKEGFRELLYTMDPRYELPSRKYFSVTAIPKLYTETREIVSRDVKTAKFFAATTDLWSSQTMQPYLSYTIHFVGKDWKLHARCLQTLYLPQNHTGENLAEAMRDTLQSWGLDPVKQVCLTTDNGANMVCAVRLLGWTHISCFGHNLHLAVGNAMKDDHRVSRALGVCRKIVSTFSHSWNKRRDMVKVQLELGLPQHSLVTDCATRWGSMQKMVERIIEQEKVIRKVLSDDRKCSHLIPTWQDIDVLESLQSALGPLSDFTDMLSAEDYVTVSSLKPVLHILKSEVLVEKDSDTQLTKDIKNRILGYLEEKYSDRDLSAILNVTTFLDPRFMTEYISNSVEVSTTKDRLAREGTQLVELSPTTSITSSDSDSVTADGKTEPPKKIRKLGSWLRAAKQNLPSEEKTPEAVVNDEIQRYIQSTKPDPETKPLEWWRLHASSYPILAQLAARYLCICASSSASERLFSTSGHISSDKRCSLKPDKLNMLVFLARNL